VVRLSAFLSTGVPPFDASLEGQVNVSGPAATPAALRGDLQLTTLEAHSLAAGAAKKPRVDFAIHNVGNIQVSLANSLVTVRNFKVAGPYTDLTVSGTASIDNAKSINLKANGNVKLEMLEAFDTDIISSGAVTLNAAMTGTTSRPAVNGRLQLQNASFNMMSLPNGLSDANGAINFNGTEAVIENLTGQTGGGKVTLAGSVGYGGPEARFHLQATASHVRFALSDSVSTEADAHLTLEAPKPGVWSPVMSPCTGSRFTRTAMSARFWLCLRPAFRQ